MFQVADVVSGKHDDVIGNVTIVDCRYPYEYDGGHIQVGEKHDFLNIQMPLMQMLHI
jgi:hypothetical protein